MRKDRCNVILKEAIRERGFRTQKDFAKSAGIGEDLLSKIIHGKRFPSLKVEKRICKALERGCMEVKVKEDRYRIKVKEGEYNAALKAAIHRCGFRTQEEFAQRARIRSSLLSDIIHGRALPMPEAKKRICKILKVDPSKIFPVE